MNTALYLLVDFENVQPSSEDVARVRSADHHLWVFHGPHQNKFDAALVNAAKRLGDRLQLVQSLKIAKNALDFHIAFRLGVLVEANRTEGRLARYVVVTKDGGLSPLIEHMRNEGCAVDKAPSIPEALAMCGSPLAEADSSSTSARAQQSHDADRPMASSRPSRGIIDAIPLPKPKGPAGGKSQVPVPESMSDDAAKAIAHLRTYGKNRPADRNALERHMGSMLGRKIAIEASRKIVSELEARKAVTFKGNKIEYKLPRKAHSPSSG